MKGSLRDQLLKAGLVDDKQAKKAEAEKKQKAKQANKARKSGRKQGPSAAEIAADKARQEREMWAERSRELNRAQEEKRARKALRQEVARLVEKSEIPYGEGDLRYHFSHNGKIKRIYVTKKQQDTLTRAELAIVHWQGKYRLVPASTAETVSEKMPDLFVYVAEVEAADPDDPYADFPIPEDLDW